jgi:hypothetical protein
VAGEEVIGVPSSLEDEGAVGLAQLRRRLYQRVQDRLEAGRRTTDDLEDFLQALAVDETEAEIPIERGDAFAHVVEHGLRQRVTVLGRVEE